MFGRLVPTPRWQQAYGRDYRFTGHINSALPVRPEMEPFLRWSQATIDARLNGLLLNWYEGPLHHCIGPHRDSSAGLSTSNGASSLFRLSRSVVHGCFYRCNMLRASGYDAWV